MKSKSWIEKPKPFKIEETKGGFLVTVDDGYRTDAKFDHSCGLDNIFYYRGGWKCIVCNEEFGENEALDRLLLHTKIMCIADDMHENGTISFSNHTHFLSCIDYVIPRCVKEDKFDTESIRRFILKQKHDTQRDLEKT
jgi:hypothetical protein